MKARDAREKKAENRRAFTAEQAVLAAIREHRFPAIGADSDEAAMLAGGADGRTVVPLDRGAVERLIRRKRVEALDYTSNWKILRERKGRA